MAVVKIPLPPLRARPGDIPLLVEKILAATGLDEAALAPLRAPSFLAALEHAAWPGNVRELRNHLERCLVFRDAVSVDPEVTEPGGGRHVSVAAIDARVPYAAARQQALDDFEREYVRALVQLHDGNVTRAAEAAGVTRVHVHRLLRRHR
jgi:DNA-binding NtrC family response regulator